MGMGMNADMPTLPDTMPREERFIECLSYFKDERVAALHAGYSETTAGNIRNWKLNDPKFIAKLRTRYNGSAAMLLPRILAVESKAVELVNDDPTLLPKFRHTLKELKQSAGVLQPDAEAGQPVIQITNIRSMVLQMQEEPAIIQEAEVVPIAE